ncbi:lysosomal proton-coupled steroid conjugate and bile acid symporter SLC46A3-like [Palaemon carinicauda]|uniref:lysosomal proton-coupled steroid conjugate and bile acid symporter SLC46A3-like n=1 Tax=Palaemon carinicauda TaxID=392227 RepID=UPI0035B609BC
MSQFLNALKSMSVEPVMLIDGACNQAMLLFIENAQMNKICSVNLDFPPEVCENLADHPEESVLVQKYLSIFAFYNSIIMSVPSLLFVLFMGAWSDLYGRKIPILITLLCHGMYAAGYLINSWQTSWPVEMIYLVTFFESLSGGTLGLLTSSTSYISDICRQKNRTSRVSIAASMWHLGGPLGTLIGALIIKHADYNIALALVLLAYILAVVYVIFLIKESHGPFAKKELLSKGSLKGQVVPNSEGVTISKMIKDFFNWRRVVESFKTVLKKREGNTRSVILIIIASNMIRRAARGFFMYLFVRQALQWDATDYGYWISYRNLLVALGSMFLIPLLTKLCDIKDATLVVVGSLSLVAEYVCCGLVINKSLSFLLWLAPVVGIISNASTIAFRSLPTKLVDSNEKGRINAVGAALNGFMPMVGYAVYTPVYYKTVESFPSAQFFVGASFNLLIISMFVYVHVTTKGSSYDTESHSDKSNKKLVNVFKNPSSITVKGLIRTFSTSLRQENAILESSDFSDQAHQVLKPTQECDEPGKKNAETGVVNQSFSLADEDVVSKNNS